MPVEPALAAGGPPAPVGRRAAYLGAWVDVAVYRWDDLTPNAEIMGPVVFESPTTAAVVRAGERVRVTPHGWLDIRI